MNEPTKDPGGPKGSRFRLWNRRRFLKLVGMAGGALAIGGGIYSSLIEPCWLEANEYDIKTRDLPAPLEGLRILHLSDLHHGNLVSADYIRDCADFADSLSPDLVCITGDFVSRRSSYIAPCLEALSKLHPPLGTFAVPGNHDYWAGAEEVFSEIRKAGIRLLINEAVPIKRNGAILWLVGLDDLWAGRPDADVAMSQVADSNPRILLMHNPDLIEEIAHNGFPLVLAGHTHGGQIRLPLIGPPVVPSRFGAKYAAGLFHVGSSTLYVNKGIGLIGPPIRLFTRPEVACFNLKRA